MSLYCTTFCNHPHYVDNGRPYAHECYVLNPKKLQRERDGDDSVYQEDMRARPVRVVRGRAAKTDERD